MNAEAQHQADAAARRLLQLRLLDAIENAAIDVAARGMVSVSSPLWRSEPGAGVQFVDEVEDEADQLAVVLKRIQATREALLKKEPKP